MVKLSIRLSPSGSTSSVTLPVLMPPMIAALFGSLAPLIVIITACVEPSTLLTTRLSIIIAPLRLLLWYKAHLIYKVYCIERVMVERLHTNVLEATVEQCAVSMDVVVHESVDSTNNWSLQQSKAGKDLPFVCFAEEQLQGKGRRGKRWLMTAYSNVAMSVAWPFALSQQSLNLLPLSVALAVVETLEGFGLKQVQIKWPNDVYVRGKKIAGVLIETQPLKSAAKSERSVAVVIGVGVNYEMSSLNNTESLVFTDMMKEVKLQTVEGKLDRTVVASALLKNIVAVCQNYRVRAKQYLEKYRSQYDYCKAKNVELILDNKEVLSGVAQGVNDEAELLVMVDGRQCVFNSAEVSVRPVKGFVE